MSTHFDTIMVKINKASPQDNAFLNPLCFVAKQPNSLHYIGTLPAERHLTIAIVGTRKPSSYGKEVTKALAEGLARRGVVIVSGLALGIDAIAHSAALDAKGTTIAVLANGLPNIYPATNRQLGEKMVASGGAIISEYEPHSSAKAYQFLARNRLVSGLSDAVIITEAAARSGTLNTAAHALEQGKDVYVVPGNITSPLSAGCNALIAQGATPITSVDEFIAQFVPTSMPASSQLTLFAANPEEERIILLLNKGIRDGDELQAASGLDAQTFSLTLTMLELNGHIQNHGANMWSLK
ncbi:DNA-protecting protein DprA [Candidatus Saccharibacteria bacterium]|nr:DNA-protecting protein DprA [Candidatus Saccharibacteria bacterium]